MAKSKHTKKKKKGSSAAKKGPSASKKDSLSRLGMLSSKFITRMRDAFLGPEGSAQLWGDDFADPDDKQLIGEDLSTALRSMFLRLEIAPRPAPLPGTPGSATKLLAQLITETNWPENDADFPTPRPWGHDTFRRYEITCAVNILMRAYNLHGPGGPPTWPPERPK